MLDARKVTAQARDEAEVQLSASSRARLHSIGRDSVRRRFVLSRSLIRLAAAASAECDPATVRVAERSGNSPLVTLPAGDRLFVSLTHSGSWICTTVSPVPMGLDVEVVNDSRDVRAISEAYFSSAEHDWLFAQPEPTTAFYRLWTGKEAIFKLFHELGRPEGLLDIRFSVLEGVLGPPAPASWVTFVCPASSLVCSVAGATSAAIPK